MPSQHMTTNEVGLAARTVKDDIPYSAEIRNILNGAYVEAIEGELYWAEEGKPHLRTVLKTTPLGVAVVELARAINKDYAEGNNETTEV